MFTCIISVISPDLHGIFSEGVSENIPCRSGEITEIIQVNIF